MSQPRPSLSDAEDDDAYPSDDEQHGLDATHHRVASSSSPRFDATPVVFPPFLDAALSSPFQRLVEHVGTPQPLAAQVETLHELCETLTFSNDETLRVSETQLETLVPRLVAVLDDAASLDVLLLATRAVATLCELAPSRARVHATDAHVIPVLCRQLVAMEYMDVADQALGLLETLVWQADGVWATRARREVVEANGLVALLQHLDFFPIEMQRKAVDVVATVCSSNVPLEMESAIVAALPYLATLLCSSDASLLLSTVRALEHIGQSPVVHENDTLRATLLSRRDIGHRLLEHLSAGPDTPTLPRTGYTSIVRFFNALVQDSTSLTCQVRTRALPPLLSTMLANYTDRGENVLLYETLALVRRVLPREAELARPAEVPSPLLALAHDLVPLIPRVYDSTFPASVRGECLTILLHSCMLLYTRHKPLPDATCLAAFLARVLRPEPLKPTESIPDTERSVLALALQLLTVPLQQETTRAAATRTLTRHGLVSFLRVYAAQEEGTDDVGPTAATILRVYFQDTETATVRVVTRLQQFVAATSALCPRGTVDELVKMLVSVKRIVEHPDAFCTAHELCASGLVPWLTQVLSCEQGQAAMRRVVETDTAFVVALVRCVQEGITSTCSLSVGRPATSVAAELEQLTHHLKVHVLLDDDQASHEPDEETDDAHALKAWRPPDALRHRRVQDTVVLVEPLARIETIEDFIAAKVFDDDALLEELTDSEQDERELVKELARNESTGRRLVAMYRGHVLAPELSLVEALVTVHDMAKSTRAPGEREPPLVLWTTSHDMTFRVVRAGRPTGESVSSSSTRASRARRAPTPVDETMWTLLRLLALVRTHGALEVYAPHLDWTHAVLTQHVARALLHPLDIVTHALPPWTFRLVHDFSFVLDFATRWHFVAATTWGTARAIAALCRSLWRQAVLEEPVGTPARRGTRRRERSGRTGALATIAQMVPLGRVKVRVARWMLLECAMKIMAVHGGPRSVLEMEFVDEVGTGVGPTTEFYTLVWQEIQFKRLQLWRDEDPRGTTTTTTTRLPEPRELAGYHRVGVYYCAACYALSIPKCRVHGQLFTHEKVVRAKEAGHAHTSVRSHRVPQPRRRPRASRPQCADCLDMSEWQVDPTACACGRVCDGASHGTNAPGFRVHWWILSDHEAQYLAQVFPPHATHVVHPVLQCIHCETVNFPGTDTGLVVLDGDRMVSGSGRRLSERDYRSVTHHVSPVCHGTPLVVRPARLRRDQVETLVAYLLESPVVVETQVDALAFLTPTSSAGPVVNAPYGLYPKPYLCEAEDPREEKTSATMTPAARLSDDVDVVAWFRFLGRLVAQALLDDRLVNLPLARPFLRALRGDTLVGHNVRVETSLSYVYEMDPALATSLKALHELAQAYAHKVAAGDTACVQVTEWTTHVASLALTFTMIGADEIALLPNGHARPVTLATLDAYVRLNLLFLLDTTIRTQVQAFRDGLEHTATGPSSSAWPLRRFLNVLDVDELEALLSDRRAGSSLWDRDGTELRQYMVCTHGYTAASRVIHDLVAILCALSIDEQRLFVRFVTGANRLPLGGLRTLEPKLTVVRKIPARHEAPDALLPSASTCTNYLKLPEYSTRDVLQQRLVYCIHEGQCSFHLS
ncbi:hypothetical protein PsorP6_017326 [Peronosclerospora sorghi]|uniref:Uncharacterized protein n=1 Tax=Peronosclerospora sorghi TaxID=230839 RepID=A0ACC0WLP0_9STRA|nr:hypothetical protein PsorP6_017326 [Peronosclerospora sorghi]